MKIFFSLCYADCYGSSYQTYAQLGNSKNDCRLIKFKRGY